MAYIINRYNGQDLIVLEDGTIDTTYSLGLVGRNYVGYGETQNENFIYLLENFANNLPPRRPLEGQLWFDSDKNLLNVYDGDKWVLVGAASISETPPSEPNAGALWYRSVDDTLHVFNGLTYTLIGPESIPGFNTTRPRARTIKDNQAVDRPIIELVIDGTPIAIVSAIDFVIDSSNAIAGFSSIKAGITINSNAVIAGSLNGNASTASKLLTRRNINGTAFDGTADITITAATTGTLIKGDYIVGENFNGSSNIVWSVDASSGADIGKIVVRDSVGNFSANTITANLIGNVVGNVQIDNGFSTFNEVRAQRFIGATLTGIASAADKLTTARLINDVPFDGSINITVPASATSLTGNFIAPTVLSSSLTQVGILQGLAVDDNGVTIGNGNDIKIGFRNTVPYIKSQINAKSLDLELTDTSYVNPAPRLRFLPSTLASQNGGAAIPTLAKDGSGDVNLGLPSRPFNKLFLNDLDTSTIAVDSFAPKTGTTTTMNGDFVVTGSITVQGSVMAINTTETTVEDKTLTIAYGSVNAAAADGAGVIIDAAGASLLYAVSGDKWVMNKPLDMGANNVTTTGLFQGLATSARYADLAENYVADRQYEPGTVLELGGEFEVTIAEDETRKVVGVVSANPAYLMNSDCAGQHVVAIALQGRVPCKVRGKIRKGDMLVSGGNGYARPTQDPKLGTIIGKSLEDFEGIDGIIEVLVGRL